jgi:hypothetical protein
MIIVVRVGWMVSMDTMMGDGNPVAIFRCVALSAFDRPSRFDRVRDLSPSSLILCARLIKAINNFKVL